MHIAARLFAFAVCFAALSPAWAAELVQSIGVNFPDQVAGYKFVKRTEFPQKGLGVNIAYETPTARGSVFIYDAGLSSIPANLEAPVVRKHFDQVISEVQSLQQMGRAKSVTLTGPGTQTTRLPGCGTQFLWRDYDMVVSSPPVLKSSTYLGVVNNNFVKLRMTYSEGAPDGKREIERFVAAISKVVARCA